MKSKNMQTINLKHALVVLISIFVISCGKKEDSAQPANAPAPAPNPAAVLCNGNGSNLYFPLKLGNKWTYNKGKQNSIYQTITKAENQSSDVIFTSISSQYGIEFDVSYVLKPNGDIYRVSDVTNTLFVPANPTLNQEYPFSDGKMIVESLTAEAVTPSCKYTNCLLLVAYYANGNERSRYYFKKGIGKVREGAQDLSEIELK